LIWEGGAETGDVQCRCSRCLVWASRGCAEEDFDEACPRGQSVLWARGLEQVQLPCYAVETGAC